MTGDVGYLAEMCGVSCKNKKDIADPSKVTMKNSRLTLQRVYPHYGNDLIRMLGTINRRRFTYPPGAVEKVSFSGRVGQIQIGVLRVRRGSEPPVQRIRTKPDERLLHRLSKGFCSRPSPKGRQLRRCGIWEN